MESTKRERDESEDAIKVQRERVTSLRMEIERLKDDLLVANSNSSKASNNNNDKYISFYFFVYFFVYLFILFYEITYYSYTNFFFTISYH